MQDDLRRLLMKHCDTLRSDIETLSAALRPLDGRPGARLPSASLTEASALAHRIKGSSGSIGFMEVSAAAARLHEALSEFETTRGNATKVTTSLELLAERIGKAKPEDSRLYAIDFSDFERLP